MVAVFEVNSEWWRSPPRSGLARINHPRSRVIRCENVISKVKAHAIFKVNFTGSYEMLCSMITVTGHVTAYELRQFQRFASYGPWPH